MDSVKITWPASNASVLGAAQSVVGGTPLIWNPTPNVALQYDGVQYAANTFTAPIQAPVSNTGLAVTYPAASIPYVNMPYATARTLLLFSITPDASIVGNITMGYGTEGMIPVLLDTYNKNSITTLQYIFTVGAAISLVPRFTVGNVWTYSYGVPTNIFAPTPVVLNTSSVLALLPRLNLTNPNIVCSGNGAAGSTSVPVITPVTISISNLAMSSLVTQVIAGTTAGFSQNIMQQGGHY